MRSRPTCAAIVAACLTTFTVATSARAADINLMTTGAVEYILRDLIPPFERASGHKVNMTVFGTVVAVDKLKEEGARALSSFLQLETSVDAIRKNGMVPAPR